MEKAKEMGSPKIFAAIAGVIADVGTVAKDKVNKQQGFKYRSVDDVFNAIHPALAKNKVFIVPRILKQTREVITTKSGAKMTSVICEIKFTFYADDGSHVEAVVIGEGLDTGDKGTNKAMAIAYKYACFQVFCIPTEDMIDPDSERPELTEGTDPAKGKSSAPPKKAAAEPQQNGDEKVTVAMLETIRAEQKRAAVTDEQILSRKCVKAKKIEDMTVTEFKAIMEIFKKCPDAEQEAVNE